MKVRLITLLLFTINLLSFSQDYVAEDFKAALFKTKTGALIVYTGTKHAFTLDIISDSVKPTEKPNFLIINNKVFQSIILPFQAEYDYENMSIEDQKSNLLGYMNYELDYIKNELNIKIGKENIEWLEINNRACLLWFYDMPKSNKTVERQTFITTICFDHILNLNVPSVRGENSFTTDKDLLLKIANSLKLLDEPIDLKQLYNQLNK